MKKIICTAAVACLLLAVAPCKTARAEKKAKPKADVTASVDEQKNSEDQKSSEEEKKSEDQKASEDKKNSEESAEIKDFTGWIKSSKKNITERFGKIQIKIKSGKGSYTIAALNEEDKAIPLLSTANEYVTNALYLKTSKKMYNLMTDGNVRAGARQTTDGAVISYEIPSLAQISLYFACMSSEKKKDPDMIKVTATVKNISNRNDEFFLKAIFDTVLGESGTHHFYTCEDVPVKSEVLYRTLQNQKWFVSKNVNAAMQFFFTGADCTTPDLVALANYSTLEKNSWEPDMLSYRGFDTVLSYNNSAVCAIWKPMKLAPSESGKAVFYIAMSGNGTPASGEKYVYSKEFAEKTEEVKGDGKPVSGLEVITPYSVEDAKEKEAEKLTSFGGTETITDMTDKPAEIPNVDFYIKNMTKEHLTPEYIQSLLDRIAALEEDSSSLNRQELLALNAELDAILTYLRQ